MQQKVEPAAELAEAPLRHDWTAEEILALMQSPLLGLLHRAQTVHQANHAANEVELASLLSIKTGACPEDCKYCPQSAHYAKQTGLSREALMDVPSVLAAAARAKAAGATRFCMGAAWREVKDGKAFDAVIEMVKGVRAEGMEACVTLGMLNEAQAGRLAEAGLTAYNHNLDTSPEFYSQIISTRSYQDRLDTLQAVRDAGITLCTGGIIGMGETLLDRARLLQMLASLKPHPESVPINALVPVAGTPLAGRPPIEPVELVRMIAAARIVMPTSRVRLSAGHQTEDLRLLVEALAAGANSIFYGEKLLTTDNNDAAEDLAMLAAAGLKVRGSVAAAE